MSDETKPRVWSEESISDINKRLVRAQKIARVGFLRWDFATDKLEVTDEVLRIYGIDASAIEKGSDLVECIHPDDAEFIREGLERAARNETALDLDHRIVRPDGEVRWVHAQAELDFENGAPSVLFGTLIDITARKRAEEQVRTSQALLHKAQEQLLQSQKMEAIGRLAGGVAHDINNMLAGITGYASLLLMDFEPDSPKRQDADEIIAICRKARDLTGNLLGFARKGKYRKERISLNKFVQRVQEILLRSISKQIEVETRLVEECSEIEGDPGQIEQILMNLCINAADAMGDRGVLTISTREITLGENDAERVQSLEPGRYVELTVADTGCGMDAEVQAQAFEPFFTTKPQGQGTGLGLSMVYGAIKNHGGIAILDSKPEQGTTVTILLPALPPADREEATRTPDEQQAAVPEKRGTILLVDDEKMVRDTTSRLMAKRGYRMLQAEDGVQAVERYRKDPAGIDLVLLDMGMPVMGGAETFAELKAIDPEVQVLLFSGFSADAKAEGLIAAGALGFIQKPFRIDELAEAVAEVMARLR